MSTAHTDAPDPQPLEAALRHTHRSVLGLLATCAVVIVLHGFSGEEPPPDRLLTTVGVGIGLTTVVLRRLGGSPVVGLRASFFLLLGALLLAASLGLLGAWITWARNGPETGILFTLAGVIFAIRPGQPVARRS